MAFADVTPSDALDMLVRWQPADRAEAIFSSGIDAANRTVRIFGGGIWNEADAHRYFEDQAPIVAEARRRYGALRVFLDVREWVVEGPQSALQFQSFNEQLYRREDRLAALVRSSLFKQHPRTALCAGTCEVFISQRAAETWLQAYSDLGQALGAAR